MFAQEIKKRRNKKGWSQRELARRIGAGGAYISALETGMNLPKYIFAARLAEELEWPVEELWANVEESRKRPLLQTHGPGLSAQKEAKPQSEREIEITKLIRRINTEPAFEEACFRLNATSQTFKSRKLVFETLRLFAIAMEKDEGDEDENEAD